MKIARCAHGGGAPTWAVVNTGEGTVQAISGSLQQWSAQVAAGDGLPAYAFTGDVWPLEDVRLMPPAEVGATVYVAGANYTKHLKEFRLESPRSPFAFLKPYRALTGPQEDIPYPTLTRQLDFEVELVVVIGAQLQRDKDPMRAVLGYTVGNDISARDLQQGPGGAIGMDFLSGKGLDRRTPVGPWIVTRDKFGDVTPDLRLTLRVNGELRQDGRTSEMTWNVAQLLSFINSRSMLLPGDILFTGSPAGVAYGDGRYLQAGDVVETAIERIGTLRNTITAAAPDMANSTAA